MIGALGEVQLPDSVEPPVRRAIGVAARYGCDVRHARHVASLACRIFDQIRPLHGLRRRHRQLLEQAAILYQIGSFFSHRPSAGVASYVITHADLEGFDRRDHAEIAEIARIGLGGRSTGRSQRRRSVRVLGSFLRLAIALDRVHAAAVVDVDVKVRREMIRLEVRADDFPGVEIESARREGRLFAAMLDRELEVVYRPVIVRH